MRFDLPTPDDETRPFYEAAGDGKLLIKHCTACGEHHFYPRPFCPTCWSEQVEWVEASGTASLYTYSVVHRNDLPPFPERVPYVAAIVQLAEGPRMETNIVDADPGSLEVGMALQVTFRAHSDDLVLPFFTPAQGAV